WRYLVGNRPPSRRYSKTLPRERSSRLRFSRPTLQRHTQFPPESLEERQSPAELAEGGGGAGAKQSQHQVAAGQTPGLRPPAMLAEEVDGVTPYQQANLAVEVVALVLLVMDNAI